MTGVTRCLYSLVSGFSPAVPCTVFPSPTERLELSGPCQSKGELSCVMGACDLPPVLRASVYTLSFIRCLLYVAFHTLGGGGIVFVSSVAGRDGGIEGLMEERMEEEY